MDEHGALSVHFAELETEFQWTEKERRVSRMMGKEALNDPLLSAQFLEPGFVEAEDKAKLVPGNSFPTVHF